MKRCASLILALAFSASGAWSADYGLSLSLSPEYSDEEFSFTATASPWYSFLVGEKSDFYLSGVAETVYEDEDWTARFDLGRFQATIRPRPGFRLEAGRISYTDVSGFVARGLYDGARFFYAFRRVNFLVGGLYSGLLNKERAEIVMSKADADDALDEDVYFAPRRALASAAVEIPYAIGPVSLTAEALGQFDMRGGDEVVHSQYLCFGASGPVGTLVSFTASFAAGLAEAANVDIGVSLAFRTEVSYYPPRGSSDRAYLGFKWASGDSGSLDAFLPVKGFNAGTVFNAGLSGVGAFKGGYFVRLLETLSFDLSTSLFLRQGSGVADPELDSESDDAYLGTELYGDVIFAPTSELALTGGVGVFFPSGAAFVSDAGVRPLFAASLIVSF